MTPFVNTITLRKMSADFVHGWSQVGLGCVVIIMLVFCHLPLLSAWVLSIMAYIMIKCVF